MNIDWSEYLGKTVNITLKENYGMVNDTKNESPLYEIVFKTGKLINVFDEGYILETVRENQKIRIFIPHSSIKCIEIFGI